MSIRLKWFIHEYYFAIATCTFLIVIILAPILYFKGAADWKILLTVIGGLSSFFFFIQKQELDEAKFINELLVQFNHRYDNMNEKLDTILKVNKANRDFESYEIYTLYDYFNLCGEEYLFYRRGYIYPEVWKSWVAGMKIYHDDKRIQKLWADELSSQSYYGLDIIKEIRQLS
ncbi:MAG: hypothetical protein KKC39_01210 [Candidatus Omnitrophica bacterium]|nr:hypothetical protein [Candidatus Omnitrophota bacterium]MCG2707149.1 hypothetical protein [Candidatus Omnitrophota bacterium]